MLIGQKVIGGTCAGQGAGGRAGAAPHGAQSGWRGAVAHRDRGLCPPQGIKYGLQQRGTGAKPGTTTAKPAQPAGQQKLAMFGGDSDSEDEDTVNAQVCGRHPGASPPGTAVLLPVLDLPARAPAAGMRDQAGPSPPRRPTAGRRLLLLQVARQATKKRSDAKVQEMYAQALLDDPTVFDYDGVHDSIQQERVAAKQQAEQGKQSRYIATLMEQANVRKREQDIAYERRLVSKPRQPRDAPPASGQGGVTCSCGAARHLREVASGGRGTHPGPHDPPPPPRVRCADQGEGKGGSRVRGWRALRHRRLPEEAGGG